MDPIFDRSGSRRNEKKSDPDPDKSIQIRNAARNVSIDK